jgi:hypothetical protein
MRVGRERDEELWIPKEPDDRHGILKELMHMTIATQVSRRKNKTLSDPIRRKSLSLHGLWNPLLDYSHLPEFPSDAYEPNLGGLARQRPSYQRRIDEIGFPHEIDQTRPSVHEDDISRNPAL